MRREGEKLMARSQHPRFNLTIEALPDDGPPIVRLRRILKALLRSYRFRCLSAIELPADNQPAAPALPGGAASTQDSPAVTDGTDEAAAGHESD